MTSPHRARAELLFEQRRYDLAEPEFRAALAAEPNDARLHGLLALALCELNRDEEAADEARAAIGLAPDDPLGHAALGFALADLERWQAARTALGEAIRLDPRNPAYFGTLARTWLGQQRWQQALEAAESGLAIDPEHASCLHMRSLALAQLGRPAEAGATAQAALARDPESSPAHANRGFAALHAGRMPEALEAFREALRIDPGNEFARSGVVEALKARNAVYALVLRYFLWMSRLPPGVRLALIFGAPFVYRAVRGIAREDGGTAPWFYPLAVIYIGFLLLSWLAVPIFNLLLRLDPLGRHALTSEDIAEANLVGGALALALVAGIAGLVTGNSAGYIGALGGAILALPLASIFRTADGWPRTLLMGVSLAVGVLVVSAMALVATDPGGLEGGGPGLALAAAALVVGIVSTWLATWLRSSRPA